MLLPVLALLGSLVEAPAAPVAPAPLADAPVSLVLQASGTHFAARNVGGLPQLCWFHDPATGHRSALYLAPGAHLVVALPSELCETLRFEAFDGGWLGAPSAGSFTIGSLRSEGTSAVWCVREGGSVTAYRQSGTEVQAIEPGPSLFPELATHVPAPIPSEDRRTRLHRLEKRSLPPV